MFLSPGFGAGFFPFFWRGDLFYRIPFVLLFMLFVRFMVENLKGLFHR